MGREVRNVPPNWEHPKKEVPDYRTRTMTEQYQPMFDRDVESRMVEWLKGFAEWQEGEFARVRQENPDCGYKDDEPYRSYCDWNGQPPDPEYYRPLWREGEATWFQLYETVSEGTPVSPPFASKEELAQYLADNGDFWYQQDRAEGRESFRTKPTLEQSRSLVNTGWAPSLIVERSSDGVKVMDAYEQQGLKTD